MKVGIKIKKKITIIILFLIAILTAWNLKPRSFEGKRQIAFIEFEHYIDDNNMDKKYFRGPYLNLKNPKFTEFYWILKVDSCDSGIVSVMLPEYSFQESIVTYSGDSTAWNSIFNSDPKN